MDRASIIGLILGFGAVMGGNFFEGGKIDSILQPTAALIVIGGTAGATLLSFPFSDIGKAFRSLRDIFYEQENDAEDLIQHILRLSGIVRRNGFIAVEAEFQRIENQFFKKTLKLAVDGMLPKMLVETMERENMTFEDENRRIAKVFDTAGGFSPTIGIIGAVLGLIHVMENLADPSKLGAGIAVAFVATIYGVGIANLMLLPIARKLINKMNRELSYREMIVEGIVGLQSGINPYYLERKLRTHVEGRQSKG